MATRSFVRLRSAVFIGNYHLSGSITLRNNAILSQYVRAFSCSCPYSCSSVSASGEISVQYRNGLPVFSVPLPSRRENCQFTMRPLGNTLGDFSKCLVDEDHGVDRVAAYTADGERIAGSTPIDILLRNDFHLLINDQKFTVQPPSPVGSGHADTLTDLSDVKTSISQLYSTLNIEQFQIERERDLLRKLELLKAEREPLEKLKLDLAERARKRTHTLSWLGLGLMGLQFGILARLTWWEYSWDIMEPVTYFITYGTSIVMFSYYVLTRQEYLFPDARDREFLLTFHKHAKKSNLDVTKYNQLCDDISQTEYDLKRLRDPLQLHIPISHLDKDKAEQEGS